MSPRVPVSARISRIVIAAGAAIACASLALMLVGRPDGVTLSRDAGAPTVPLLWAIGPAVVGITIALALSHRRPRLEARPLSRGRLTATTLILGALAVLFPVVAAGMNGEDYVLTKTVLLIVAPLIAVALIRGSVAMDVERAAWRWWAPGVAILVWAVLRSLVSSSPDYSEVDAVTLLIAATATAVTAGFGEELFYRRLLQTRLEALFSPWAGVTVATAAFALMHLGSHATGDLLFDTASVIVVQGSFGLLMGVIWMRFRNFTAIVTAHVLANGWPDIIWHVFTR